MLFGANSYLCRSCRGKAGKEERTSLPDYGHPGKYSYEIPREYLKGWGNPSGKIISAKRNHWSNLVSFFFQIAISSLAYVTTFSGQLYFGRSYFFILFQSNYFDTTVTFSGQLFLQNSCFFPLLQNSHFFAGVLG